MVKGNLAAGDLHLLRGQVWPRRREILRSWVLWLSSGVAILLGLSIHDLPGADLTISSVATFGITYAGISAGACFTAIVLSLGLPGAERLRSWARKNGVTEGKSALSDLVFVLTWAALAQIVLIVACSLALAFGGDIQLSPSGVSIGHIAALIVGLFVFFYAVFELVIVLQTLVQISVVIIAEERKDS